MNKNLKLTNQQLSAVGIKRMNNDKETRAKQGKTGSSEFTNTENK